jgi:hypothetical protein
MNLFSRRSAFLALFVAISGFTSSAARADEEGQVLYGNLRVKGEGANVYAIGYPVGGNFEQITIYGTTLRKVYVNVRGQINYSYSDGGQRVSATASVDEDVKPGHNETVLWSEKATDIRLLPSVLYIK